MTLTEWAQRIQAIAVEKGFSTHDPLENATHIDRKLLLAVGEIVEAQEELRKGHGPGLLYYEGEKPEGFGVEVADAIIRLLQLSAALGLDIEQLVEMKVNYNATRPFKHGKVF